MTKKSIKRKKSSIKKSSTQKSANKEVKKNSSLSKLPAKLLTKSRSVRSKENTLAYYNCLMDQVASPLNQRVKITAMCHQCKHNKGKVQVAKQAEKQQLVKEVAQNYLAFGKSLSNLLHDDIVGCVKEKKK